MTREELKEFLKTVKDAGFELGDVEVNVVTVKDKDADKEESSKVEEFLNEEDTSKAGALLKANIRFAKAIEAVAKEQARLSSVVTEILRENEKLRRKLEEKK